MKQKRQVLLVFGLLFAVLCSLSVMGVPFLSSSHAFAAGNTINVWWPANNASVQGTQPFKAMVAGLPVEQYDMYWQVDGGGLNAMQNNYTDYPHKEASVDLSGWSWRGSGPYTITFVAKQNGTIISQQSVQIMTGASPQTQAPTLVMNANQPAPTQSTSQPVSVAQVAVWWPTVSATLSGQVPLKAVVTNLPVEQYSMYWQVDGGALNEMQNSYTGSAHKEADIDVSGWHWQQSGNYTLAFIAKNSSGATIAQQQVPVVINAPATAVAQASAQPVVALSAPTISFSSNALAGSTLYVNPNSSAAAQASAWRSSNPAGAAAMDVLARAATAAWFGNWNSNLYSDVHQVVAAAAAQGAVPVLVAYNIPLRDCGSYSAGGASSPDAYRSWISTFASAIGSAKAAVILEPDALATMDCLSGSDQQTRLSLLSGAVSALKHNPNTSVYIDAGHSGWVDATTMSNRLKGAGVAQADGFALNVSNFDTTANNIAYGSSVSTQTGGKHFVIDTGRNGNGSNSQWCNPSGRAVGQRPTTSTGQQLVDAYLWIKTPGESDGNCNGGPAAGEWWADYARTLVTNAGL